MRYLALACDYDGTIAHHGKLDEPTLAALKRLRASGRKLIMVSGRELEDLLATCPYTDFFDLLVLENGALLYYPATKKEKTLATKPPEKFLAALAQRGVQPVLVGRVIVATWEPHEKAVLDAIHELGLELQVIFNKGAVMVLPTGVNKATGLKAALKELGLSPHNVVGVGDAENDHAFLRLCECAVAVANALPALKEQADFVTRADHGAGVTELIDELIADDLAHRDERLTRHHLLLGQRTDGHEVRIAPYGRSLLIAGPSGSGKSTAAVAFLERLCEGGYQFCIIDPEGDYDGFEKAVTLGSPGQGPSAEEILKLLARPGQNAVVNLIGLPITQRPTFFLTLLPRLQEMRARTGRPHWLIFDEAHHLLPASWQPGAQALPQDLDRLLLLTVHPGQVQPAVLAHINTVIAVGQAPEKTLREFCAAAKVVPPPLQPQTLEAGEVLFWTRTEGTPQRVRLAPGKMEHRRHVRKYAEGQLPPERSFYFHGPADKLNLRAQNLILFMQLAEGVDDETWTYHLQQGDYARWFREAIKDDALAAEAERIAGLAVSPRESRALLRAAIEQHYTLPAAPALPMPGTDAS